MTRLLGLAATSTALALALYGLVVAVLGVRQGKPELVRSARSAAYANFVLLVIANFAMVYALVTHDFSVCTSRRLAAAVHRLLHGHLALGRARGVDSVLGLGALAVRGSCRWLHA